MKSMNMSNKMVSKREVYSGRRDKASKKFDKEKAYHALLRLNSSMNYWGEGFFKKDEDWSF